MNKANQTILITGGTGMVGQVLVSHFVSQPNTWVIFTSRSSEKIAEVQKNNSDATQSKHLFGCQVDLEADTGVATLLEFLETNSLQPTVLINNARNTAHLKLPDEVTVSRAKWLGEFLLDVVVPYELSMALAGQKNCKLLSVVNVSSMYGVVAQNPHLYGNPAASITANYGVAKAALIHLTKELASQLAPTIRVNAVTFGGIVGKVDRAFQESYAKMLPAQRMLDVPEVIGPIAFLADSEKSSGCTGHNLIADGGWTIW